MKTIQRTEGDHTHFLITDVDPVYEKVFQGLLNHKTECVYGRAFPVDTPNLDPIYQNFERYAEGML